MLDVNRLNAPIKICKVVKWIKRRPIYVLSTRDPSQNKTYTQTKSNGMKNKFCANRHEKKAKIAVFI